MNDRSSHLTWIRSVFVKKEKKRKNFVPDRVGITQKYANAALNIVIPALGSDFAYQNLLVSIVLNPRSEFNGTRSISVPIVKYEYNMEIK